jgi:hypothetical protein
MGTTLNISQFAKLTSICALTILSIFPLGYEFWKGPAKSIMASNVTRFIHFRQIVLNGVPDELRVSIGKMSHVNRVPEATIYISPNPSLGLTNGCNMRAFTSMNHRS